MFERPIMKEMFATELSLSKTNPRFPHPVNTEEEAILTFFSLKKVGPKKIEALIQDIAENHSVLEDFIALKTNDEYTVYDGNRRLTALKLLVGDTASLIKDLYPKTYNYIQEVKKEFYANEIKLFVKVYSDGHSMANHVMKIHSGEQEGVGQITWSATEKNTFSSQFLNKSLSTGNQIYKLLEKDPNQQELYNAIINKGYSSTFERIFGFSDIRSRIFNLDRGIYVDLENKQHYDKIIEMIEYFISKDATVADVYTRELTNTFFSHISPISTNIDSESDTESNADNNSISSNPSINTTMSIKPVQINSGPSHLSLDEPNLKEASPNILFKSDSNTLNKSGPQNQPKPIERKYLFEDIVYFGSHRGIQRVLYEIQKLDHTKYKLSATYLVRTLLECTLQEFLKKNNLFGNWNKPGIDPSITDLINYCNNNKSLRSFNNNYQRIIENASSLRDHDQLNTIAHAKFSEPSDEKLKDIERRWYSLIEFCITNLNAGQTE
ncbi:hypothetical protein [Paenibacillus sp. IITD108]|uniref:hypothetical protein n=1 Tax=Paenibacillus sp. IITD108 TaxID=3116649 RepID=UPI002F3E667A